MNSGEEGERKNGEGGSLVSVDDFGIGSDRIGFDYQVENAECLRGI